MGEHRKGGRREVGAGSLRIARIVPDVSGIDKEFDYIVPPRDLERVTAGTMVRIDLHGRRVGGWVVDPDVDTDVDPDRLRPLAKVRGWGPEATEIQLCRWAAWRWYGRTSRFLTTASPATAVTSLPPPARVEPAPATSPDPLANRVLATLQGQDGGGPLVVRQPPSADPASIPAVLASVGPVLVVCPTLESASRVATTIRRARRPVTLLPRGWAQARAGGHTVVGTRVAAFAPGPDAWAVVVVDEHDEALQEEGAPTWHARDVALERARRAGIPCVLVSPAPSIEALALGHVVAPPRTLERAGWPVVDVVDRRQEDPGRTGIFSARFTNLAREPERRVLCVLNRTGRARLLACASCGEIAKCDRCDAAVVQPESDLECRRCGQTRPALCAACGAIRLKRLRLGVGRVREELEALVNEPVGEITATGEVGADSRVVVGTEAVLHRAASADLVAFLDFDQEILAPRLRAAEHAMSLVIRAARMVGGRQGGGRILLQTRTPDHEVIRAALLADPDRLATVERSRRELLSLPPYSAVAEISGAAAEQFVASLEPVLGATVAGPNDGRWLVRAADHDTLLDMLHAAVRPPGRLSVKVDPPRL